MIINFVILSLFTKDMKKIKQNILDIDPNLLKNKDIKFKEFQNKEGIETRHVLNYGMGGVVFIISSI